jgi:3-oxoacyl-[acyl-carrier protein] reductase
VKETFGKVDVLVNNAGVYGLVPLEAVSVAELNRHFDTNVLGTLLVTKAAIPLFPPWLSTSTQASTSMVRSACELG